jgi:hypothetical protein
VATEREFSLLIRRTTFEGIVDSVLSRRILGAISEEVAHGMARDALNENASHSRVWLEARDVPTEWERIEEFRYEEFR